MPHPLDGSNATPLLGSRANSTHSELDLPSDTPAGPAEPAAVRPGRPPIALQDAARRNNRESAAGGSGSGGWGQQSAFPPKPQKGAGVAKFLSALGDQKDRLKRVVGKGPTPPGSPKAEGASPKSTDAMRKTFSKFATSILDKKRSAPGLAEADEGVSAEPRPAEVQPPTATAPGSRSSTTARQEAVAPAGSAGTFRNLFGGGSSAASSNGGASSGGQLQRSSVGDMGSALADKTAAFTRRFGSQVREAMQESRAAVQNVLHLDDGGNAAGGGPLKLRLNRSSSQQLSADRTSSSTAGLSPKSVAAALEATDEELEQALRHHPSPLRELKPSLTMPANSQRTASPAHRRASQDTSVAADAGSTGDGSRSSETGSETAGVFDITGFGSARPSRKGVYVMLLGEQVELIGERGTKVPNISVREIALEVEATFSAVLEYNSLLGWQAPDRLSFEILHLDRQVQGSSVPLPKTLVRTILNMVMPNVFTKLFLTMLPTELGKYVTQSGERIHISGEFGIIGPALATVGAPLDSSSSATAVGEAQSAARARSILGITEVQAQALAYLFSNDRCCLLDSPRALTITSLCRCYSLYSGHSVWPKLCEIWDRALQAVLSSWGLPDSSSSSPFRFSSLMDNSVSGLARKPMRISFALESLQVVVQADAALHAVRDYFERVTREYHQNAARSDTPMLVKETLEEQLEALTVWHEGLGALLRNFKTKFRSAGATLLAAADSSGFQAGLEAVSYEGPLRLEVPLSMVNMDEDDNFMFDIKLPNPKDTMSSLTHKLQFIVDALSSAAYGGEEGEEDGAGLTQELQGMVQHWSDTLEQQQQQLGVGIRSSTQSSLSTSPRGPPLLDTPVIGRVLLRKLMLSLRLDERRVAELLDSGVQDVKLLGGLLSCFGNLFTASLAHGWPLDASEGDEGVAPRCMLTVKNNDVTRVRAELESVLFQSQVSPRIAVRLLQGVFLGMAQRFGQLSRKHLTWLDTVFSHMHEYMSKDVLDVLLGVTVKAECVDEVLRLSLSGDTRAQQAAGASGEGGGRNVWPVYVVNDLNMVTVVESIKLLME